MAVNVDLLRKIENRMLRNKVLHQIKKIYDGDRNSDDFRHYVPSEDEEINIMAVSLSSKVGRILDQLQEAGAFELWEDKTENINDPDFCFYNVNRDFWEHLDQYLEKERISETEIFCLASYVEDDEEYWTAGESYHATIEEDGTYAIDTNLGTIGRVGKGYMLEALNDNFVDLHFSMDYFRHKQELIRKGMIEIAVYRDCIEDHGNGTDNSVFILVKEATLRDYIKNFTDYYSLDEYMNEYTSDDNEELIPFLDQKGEFILPIECATRQEMVQMILETNKFMSEENRLTKDEMNNSFHGLTDKEILSVLVKDRFPVIPKKCRDDLHTRLVLCFDGKFNELQKHKEKSKLKKKETSII